MSLKVVARCLRQRSIQVDPMPETVARSFAKLERNPQVCHTMNGPSEFHSGQHDEATPRIAETVHRGIRGSEWVVFENSSHMAQAEEPDRYLTVLDEFLSRHDPS